MRYEMWLKRLLCKHEWVLERWAWTTGPFECGEIFIEAVYACKKCGKTKYVYPPRELWPEYSDTYRRKHRQDGR